MSVAVAVPINPVDAEMLIDRAVAFAERSGDACFAISIVRDSDEIDDHLRLIAEHRATPVVQEADDIAQGIISAATWFGVRTLFVQNGRRRLFRRSIAQQLLALDPPFEVVVLQREDDRRPFAWRALRANRPSVRFDEIARDRQAQT